MHYVYPQGNSLQANVESPFMQIGEYKYGKPILDRGFNFETKLSDAVKFGILSMEATVKSNVSVGGPFDVFIYETDSLVVKLKRRLEEQDPYFREIQKTWSEGIVRLVQQIPGLEFPPLAS
jgi:putative proteasome-type protease